jgi:hypothetical protein
MTGMATACTVAIAQMQPPAQTPPASTFVSPAIDKSIFREGEVQRVSGDFQSWRVVCDVVPRLNQRFCSLFGTGKDQGGRPLVRLVVTTSDDGQPAALLHLPASVGVKSVVEITAVPAPAQIQSNLKAKAASKKDNKKDNKKGGGPQRLVVVSCDSKSCMTLWKLSPEQIGALNAAGTLHIHFSVMPTPNAGQWVPVNTPLPAEAVIEGTGFAAAVNASMAKDGLLH